MNHSLIIHRNKAEMTVFVSVDIISLWSRDIHITQSMTTYNPQLRRSYLSFAEFFSDIPFSGTNMPKLKKQLYFLIFKWLQIHYSMWIFIYLSLCVVFRCEDYGRVLKTPGTRDTDAICGEIKCSRSPFLPLGCCLKCVSSTQILKSFSFI